MVLQFYIVYILKDINFFKDSFILFYVERSYLFKICLERANQMIYSGKPFNFGELQDYVLEDKEAMLRGG